METPCLRWRRGFRDPELRLCDRWSRDSLVSQLLSALCLLLLLFLVGCLRGCLMSWGLEWWGECRVCQQGGSPSGGGLQAVAVLAAGREGLMVSGFSEVLARCGTGGSQVVSGSPVLA